MDGGVKGQIVGGHSGGKDIELLQIARICPSMHRQTQSARETVGVLTSSRSKIDTANFTVSKVFRRKVATPPLLHFIRHLNNYAIRRHYEKLYCRSHQSAKNYQ
jgi:hypothetical protein